MPNDNFQMVNAIAKYKMLISKYMLNANVYEMLVPILMLMANARSNCIDTFNSDVSL